MVGTSTAYSARALGRYSPVTNTLDRRYGSVWKPFEIFHFSVANMGIVAVKCFLIAAVTSPMVTIPCSMVVMVSSMVIMASSMLQSGFAVVGWGVV